MNLSYQRDIAEWVRTDRWLALVQAHQSPVAKEGGVFRLFSQDPAAPAALQRSYNLAGVTRLMADYVYRESGKRARPASSRGGKAGRAQRGMRKSQYGEDTGGLGRPSAPEFAGAGKSDGHTMLRLTGPMRGTLVHRQIEDSVLHDNENFLRRHAQGMHPWARSLMKCLLKRGMRPFRAEFTVHDADMGAATQIDLLAVDQTGRLVFIENKTGYGGGDWMCVAEGTAWRLDVLTALGASFPCNPRNRAVVQATLGALMAVRMLRLPEEAFAVLVLRVHDAAVDYVPVHPDFVRTTGLALYGALLAARRAERRERKAARTQARALL